MAETTVKISQIPLIGDMANKLSFRSIFLLVALDLIAFTNGDFILAWNVPLGIFASVMVILIESFVSNITASQRKTTGFFGLISERISKEPELILYAILAGLLVAWKGNFLTLIFGAVLTGAKLEQIVKS